MPANLCKLCQGIQGTFGWTMYMSPNESQHQYNKMPPSKRSQLNCTECEQKNIKGG